MKFKHIAATFGILVGLYLISMAIRQGFLARNASIKPVGWRKNYIGLNDTSITVIFEAKNTTDIDITMRNIKIDVFINNQKATEIRSRKVRVPAGNVAITEAIVRFNPLEVLLDAAQAILYLGDIPIRFKGHFDIVTNYFLWNRFKIDTITTLSEITK